MNINYRKALIIENTFIALIILLVGFVRVINSVPAIKNALVMATTHQPERFTELYFENHTSLSINSFEFTVHNLEDREMTYPYEVYVQSSDAKQQQMIDKGEFILKQGDYKTISESFVPGYSFIGQKADVIVNLVNKDQKISFWTTPTNTKTSIPQEQKENLQSTGLYFTSELPLRVLQGQPINFSFGVQNLKYSDHIYPYTVYIEENGRDTQIMQGEAYVKQNSSTTISVSYQLATLIRNAKVYVRLTGENQYIYFQMKGAQ
ncbi:MAG TPA: hypothetical protein VG895_02095 [Patescibacteria group bacterium]|nr:hypothetical protein [Patescibacteria group bacterium]